MNKKIIRNLINNSCRLTAFTGAGISTHCGIPDFRGPGGIYETVGDIYHLPSPESLFDLSFFKKNPLPFYDFLYNMINHFPQPGRVHRYLSDKEKRGELSLVVTQNIDNLHQIAGMKNLIECHGSTNRGSCLSCGKSFSYQEYIPAVLDKKIPHCSCTGIIKPDIVFFGEPLSQDFYNLFDQKPETDLFIALGTSLTVEPAAQWAVEMARHNKSILINKERTNYDQAFDYVLYDDLDLFFEKLLQSRI